MVYHLNFSYIWQHFGRLAWGLLLSLEMAIIAILVGGVVGLGLALLHQGGSRATRGAISAYVELVRNTPLLLLVYFVFYGIPTFVDIRYSATASFVATLALYSCAYMVEVFRAGLSSIPKGLIEAGKSIGLTPWQRLLFVRLPTMFRIVLPALGNTLVSLFKDTSVAAVIAVPELTYGAQWINLNSFRVIEVFTVITAMYLGAGYLILHAVRWFEMRYSVSVKS